MKLNLSVLTIVFLRYLYCERKILEGQKLTTRKHYMVYLTQAQSDRNYDFWICGGAIIHRWFILTSAACVEDVQNMYAIAGYEKYVSPNNLDTDICTKNMKRKVIYTCVPEAYDLKYDKVEKWSKLDIAIVKVEKPYRPTDEGYKTHCSYVPHRIDVNYEEENQDTDRDVIMLGWGHTGVWRQLKDGSDYNHQTLLYASSLIYSKEECKKYFKQPDLSDLIDKYMVCTVGNGVIDEVGKSLTFKKRRNFDNQTVLGTLTTNKKLNTANKTVQNQDETSTFTFNATRRQGICQNDHGGPLVTWVNGKEVVIGVASLFRLNDKSKCIPPFLFTSTAHNKIFIECVLNTEKKGRRRSTVCDKPASDLGFKILRRYIPWKNHPNGMKNNPINIRHQIPMHHFHNIKNESR